VNYCHIVSADKIVCGLMSSRTVCDFYQPNNSVEWKDGTRKCEHSRLAGCLASPGQWISWTACRCLAAIAEKKMEEI